MSKYFTTKDFTCHCGCGLNNINPSFYSILDAIREELGNALIAASGSRCLKHNAEVGGENPSEHLDGDGVDVACQDSFARAVIIMKALSLGVKRIGIKKDSIHLGLSTKRIFPSPRIWLYPK
jgi:hypothetical protein